MKLSVVRDRDSLFPTKETEQRDSACTLCLILLVVGGREGYSPPWSFPTADKDLATSCLLSCQGRRAMLPKSLNYLEKDREHNEYSTSQSQKWRNGSGIHRIGEMWPETDIQTQHSFDKFADTKQICWEETDIIKR